MPRIEPEGSVIVVDLKGAVVSAFPAAVAAIVPLRVADDVPTKLKNSPNFMPK